ncbi:MAG: hypothetical protein KDC05_02370 [Bacteroidales bacterium]|nr:hypothetical protein [Bacteroidales bacterium]
MRILRNILTVSFILTSVFAGNCQSTSTGTDRSYDKFKTVFEKELNRFGSENIEPVDFVVHPVNLPDWLVQYNSGDGVDLFSLGISDPGMEENLAKQQAIFRAKTVACFLTNPSIQTVSENYTADLVKKTDPDFVEKFINYFRVLSANSFNSDDENPVYYDYNSFREAIVVIRIDLPGTGSDSIFCVGNVYQAERTTGSVMQMDQRHEIFGMLKQDNTVNARYAYSIHSINQKDEITSKLNNSQIEFPYRNFKYTVKQNSVEHSNSPEKLSCGLWKAFITALLQEMHLAMQNNPVSVKQVGDVYDGSSKNLARESGKSNRSFSINNLHIYNNQLSVTLGFIN